MSAQASASAACKELQERGRFFNLVAEMVHLLAEDRAARITISGQYYNAFEREVRWSQQRAQLQGLLRPAESGLRALTAWSWTSDLERRTI